MSEIDARISDSLALSFWSPMNFYFEHRDPQALFMHDIMLEEEKDKQTDNNLSFSPNKVFFEVNVPLLPTNELIDGKKLIFDFGWETEKLPKDNIEKISINEITKKSCMEIIDYIKKYRLNPDEYFKIAIFDFNDRIPDEFISVDWQNLRILAKLKEYERYHIAIYCDNIRMMKALRSIEKINKFSYNIDNEKELYKLFIDI